MASAQSLSLRSVPGFAQQQAQQASFTPQQINLPAPPAPPDTGGIVNPATQPRHSFLRSLLDPKSASYIGNRYRPDLQAAGRDLRQGLHGFGDYEFTEDDMGVLTPRKQEGGQPGRFYREAHHAARAEAAARGMLYSRAAEEAIGAAWHRLSQQERGMFNQYSGQVSSLLSAMASDFTSVHNELIGLYGQDIEYALRNPVLPPEPGPGESPAPGAPPVHLPGQLQPSGIRIVRNPGPGSIARLRELGYRQAGPRYGPNVWVLPAQ
jgi:hypothetical protein